MALVYALALTQPRINCDCCGAHLANYAWTWRLHELGEDKDFRLCYFCNNIADTAVRFRGLTIKTRNVPLVCLHDEHFDTEIYKDDPVVVLDRIHVFFEKAFPEFQVVVTNHRINTKTFRNLTFRRPATLVKSAHKK